MDEGEGRRQGYFRCLYVEDMTTRVLKIRERVQFWILRQIRLAMRGHKSSLSLTKVAETSKRCAIDDHVIEPEYPSIIELFLVQLMLLIFCSVAHMHLNIPLSPIIVFRLIER